MTWEMTDWKQTNHWTYMIAKKHRHLHMPRVARNSSCWIIIVDIMCQTVRLDMAFQSTYLLHIQRNPGWRWSKIINADVSVINHKLIVKNRIFKNTLLDTNISRNSWHPDGVLLARHHLRPLIPVPQLDSYRDTANASRQPERKLFGRVTSEPRATGQALGRLITLERVIANL